MLCRRVINILKVNKPCYSSSSATVLDFDDVPSVKGQLPFVGSILSMLLLGGTGKFHLYLDRRHKQLGPIFKDKVGPVNAVFVSDPNEMRAIFAQEGKYPLHMNPEPWLLFNERNNYTRGLFFMDGEEWLHYRRLMNKILMKGDLSWIEDSCNVAADIFLEKISLRNKENREFPNLEKELYKWSMDTILSVMLGADEYRQSRIAFESLVIKLAATVHLVFETTAKLVLLPAKLAAKFNIPQWRRFEDSVKLTLGYANEIIDLIQEEFKNGNGLINKMMKANIEREYINRIMADLILGAGDTTTFATEFALYLVSKNKDVQQKLRQDDKTFSRNVLKETLRLYPVAPFLNRILPDNATVCGYNIPGGTTVFMTIYTSGRDERYFKNPEQFLPDRWLRDNTHSTVMMQRASLPFATGVRSCLGKLIAETQITAVLSKIVKNYDVELCNEREIDMVLTMLSKPSEDLRLKFHKI